MAKKILFFRHKPEDNIPVKFDFAMMFPRTHAQFATGKFRWFQYHKDTLRVFVGCVSGRDN